MGAAELAKRVGVSRQTIYASEAGSYGPITAVALRLARELEVPVEELFALSGAREGPSEAVTAAVLAQVQPHTGEPVRLSRVRERWIGVPAGHVPYYLADADAVVTRTFRGSHQAKVEILGEEAFERRLLVAGCDPAIGLLVGMAARLSGVEVVAVPAASRRAIQWLKEGKVHLAGTHLEDPASGEFNLPWLRRAMPDEDLAVVTFARWEEGFVLAHGNPLGIRRIEDVARPRVRLVNREQGSGSRALLDGLLRKAGLKPGQVDGYTTIAAGHLAAAGCVAAGEADCCIATSSAARVFGMDFVPLRGERFDFAFRRELLVLPALRGVLDVLQRASLRWKLETLAGYDASETGRMVSP